MKQEKVKTSRSKNQINWVKWSTTPHTEDEIREAFFTDPDKICVSYVCRFSKLSEDFIRELIVLSTGVFKDMGDYYNDDNREVIKDIMEVEPTKDRLDFQKHIRQIYHGNADKEFLAHIEHLKMPLRSRVDWWQIASFQKLSQSFKEEFKEKFKVKSDNEFSDISNR